jgi:hypothetical protein
MPCSRSLDFHPPATFASALLWGPRSGDEAAFLGESYEIRHEIYVKRFPHSYFMRRRNAFEVEEEVEEGAKDAEKSDSRCLI